MSYILDALKRAEQERQYGQLPSATVTPATEQAREPKRLLWLVLTVLLLACAVAAISYWFASKRAPVINHSTQATMESTNNPAAVTSLPPRVRPIAAVMARAPQQNSASLPARVTAITANPVILSAPTEPTKPPPKPEPKPITIAGKPNLIFETTRASTWPEDIALVSEPANSKPETTTATAAHSQPSTSHANTNDSFSLPWLSEMPNDFRQSTPSIEIQFHRFTDHPASSFVMIDGQRYHNGDTLKAGPVLERVIEEGLLLQWRNKRFVYPIGG